MSRGVNKVILIGNLGAEPESRVMPSGGSVTNLSIATSETWTDRNTNQRQERTEWHRVVLFNRLAEVAAQYLRKGSKVYIEGSIRTRKWQDQSGQDRYSTEIVANNMQMLDSRGAGGGDSGGEWAPQDNYQPQAGGYGSQESHAPAPMQQYAAQGQNVRQQQNAPAPVAPQGGGDLDFDDDVPF